MAKETLQETFSKALVARGYKEDSTSRKYRTFDHPDKAKKVFLGKAGSVRVGRIYTESAPMTEGAKSMLLSEGKGN